MAPSAAQVVAERAPASAVLACGICIRRHFSAVVAPATRLQARAVQDQMTFVLTAMAALTRLERLSGEPWAVPAQVERLRLAYAGRRATPGPGAVGGR